MRGGRDIRVNISRVGVRGCFRLLHPKKGSRGGGSNDENLLLALFIDRYRHCIKLQPDAWTLVLIEMNTDKLFK